MRCAVVKTGTTSVAPLSVRRALRYEGSVVSRQAPDELRSAYVAFLSARLATRQWLPVAGAA